MADLNYAQQYFEALSQNFPYVLNFGALYNSPNNSMYKPLNAKTIEIPSISTTGRVDGNRDTIGTFGRNVDNTWETKVLSNHRTWNTLIHPVDVIQTNMVLSISNATKVYNEQQKFPEMDAYCVSKIYSLKVAKDGAQDTTALTVDNILSVIDGYMEAMDEARVPQTGRILYVTPAVNTLIKNAKSITRSISLKDSGTVLTREISRIDELQIIKVSSDLMKTVYNFTTGWAPGTGAKQINMFLIHPVAVITPVIYSYSGMEAPSAHTQGKYLYFEESFEDVFIMEKKSKAIKFNVEA